MLMLADDTQARRLVWIGYIGPRLEALADAFLARLFDGAAERPGHRRETLLVERFRRIPYPAKHLDDGGTDVVDGLCHTASYVEGD